MELDFDHVLRTTRSVRRNLDFERQVDPALIEECIELAVQAPTGANREAWRFLVLTEAEPKAALAALYRRALERFSTLRAEAAARAGEEPPPVKPTVRLLAERLHECPVLIIPCIEGRPEPADVGRQVAFYGSILPAAWSLMLALRSRGLGSTWTTLHLAHEREAARALGIPDAVTQTVLLPVGHMRGASLKPAARRPAREVTFWNAWGQTLQRD
jgi:nitroreductase